MDALCLAFYINHALAFYINLLASKEFQKEFFKHLKQSRNICLRKMVLIKVINFILEISN